MAAIEKTMNHIHVPGTSRRQLWYGASVSAETQRSALMLLAALLAIYVVLGMLYESYSSRSHLSTLPSAGVARCSPCWPLT